jgi:hypothetical protein
VEQKAGDRRLQLPLDGRFGSAARQRLLALAAIQRGPNLANQPGCARTELIRYTGSYTSSAKPERLG